MLSDFTRLVQDCINCSTTVLNCYNNILSTAAGRQKGLMILCIVAFIIYSVPPNPSFGSAMIFEKFTKIIFLIVMSQLFDFFKNTVHMYSMP